jgi:hypothetical protein
MLELAQSGQDVTFPGMFNPTGLYDINQQTQQDIQIAQDLNTQQNMALQTQMTQQGQFDLFDQGVKEIAAIQAAQPSIVTEQESPLVDLDYLYDFSSVFANDRQESLFGSPFGGYAKGGKVESDTDRLIRLIGEE